MAKHKEEPIPAEFMEMSLAQLQEREYTYDTLKSPQAKEHYNH